VRWNVCDRILTRGLLPIARAFPSRAATVAAGGSPHTVARPCRPFTGFRRKRMYRDCAKVAAFLLAYSQRVRPSPHLALALLTLLLGACSAHSTANAPPTPSSTSARVVTLVPSFADDLYAIGAASQLVAVSAYTDAPHTAALPRVADATSVDAEAILALKPNVVVGIPAQARLVEPLLRARVPVVLLSDDSYDSIFANLREMGALTGHRREAAATVARLRRETSDLHRRTAHFARRPSVFVVLGAAPIWTAGNRSYITTLIALAGAVNTANDLHAAYGEYSAEALLHDQPDLLIADRATNLASVFDREPWRSLRAVQLHRVYLFDPDLIERPGPSYNEGLRWLLAHVSPLAAPER
jgi:ABC-type Fe3+-hydroxamate transport system substrate-binding protein